VTPLAIRGGRANFLASVVTVSPEKQGLLRTKLHELGFDDVRFAHVASWAPPMAAADTGLQDWIAGGMHADMHWMERTLEKRLDPDRVLSGVQSVIMLGVSYWSETLRTFRESTPRWARYALNEDYHDTLEPALQKAGQVLEEMFAIGGTDYRYYVDTGPVIERGWAARAGLGFVGKNAMLISRTHGNWLFIAAILTRLEFLPDAPIRSRGWKEAASGEGAPSTEPTEVNEDGRSPIPVGLLCGKCTRCLEACPTDAFAAPGVVDARRCISYQTIENKGVIPRGLRAGIGNRIYGCDVCLEVCPWNRFAQDGRRLLLSARHDVAELSLAEILALTPERFAEVFRRTPIKRLKLVGLLRNACVVAGNSGDVTLLPQLIELASKHSLPLVRAHAVWAVHRLGGAAELAESRTREGEPIVLAEYAAENGVDDSRSSAAPLDGGNVGCGA
jgi:epoxyqueuosine reductase